MLLLALLSCSPAPSTTPLLILAAASLTDAVAELATAFEARHPGLDVQASFAGSQTLRLQIAQGAAADVFLSANHEHILALQADGRAGPSTVFARSRLALVVPDQPDTITRFAELPRAERLVIGEVATPIGQYTERLLARAGDAYGAEFVAAVRSRVVSAEPSVRLARTRVQLGEADAAIVYETDTGVEGLTAVPIPAALNVTADYHMAATSTSHGAGLWMDFLTSKTGCELLRSHGFLVDACEG